MGQEKGEKFIPIIYVFIYNKIKERNKGKPVIPNYLLKETVKRIAICNEGHGGNRKGIPKCFYYNIIQDLIQLNLLRKIDRSKYEILRNNCENRLRQFIW
jgi:hypothetical protein